MRKPKYSDEYLSQLCDENDCTLIKVQSEDRSGKTRRIIYYSCNKHLQYGEQSLCVEKFVSNKKKCQYCNHSSLKKTFAEEVKRISPSITVVGDYKEWNSPVECICDDCGYKWKGRAAVLLYGGKCPKCARREANVKESLSIDVIKERLSEVNKDIMIIGDYHGIHKKIECLCLIDGTKWEPIVSHLLSGECSCPTCKRERMRARSALSQEQFVSKAEVKNPNIKIVGKYVNNNTPVLCTCKIHGGDILANPRTILYKYGHLCPMCTQSIGESKLLKLLEKYNIGYISQYSFSDCKRINKLRFDAYDEVNKIAYEYQGEQHYRLADFSSKGREWAIQQFELNKQRDQIKREYCKSHNIHLIEIPYWETDNMEDFLIEKWRQLSLVS